MFDTWEEGRGNETLVHVMAKNLIKFKFELITGGFQNLAADNLTLTSSLCSII